MTTQRTQGSNKPDLTNYVPVEERIAAFRRTYPDGTLQAEIHTLTDALVVMVARAYRTPEDPRPGFGWASEPIPGTTPYTRGNEIANCEMSAWGRALQGLGFETHREPPAKLKAPPAPRQPPQANVPPTRAAGGAPQDPPTRIGPPGPPLCPDHQREMKPWRGAWKCTAPLGAGEYCQQTAPMEAPTNAT